MHSQNFDPSIVAVENPTENELLDRFASLYDLSKINDHTRVLISAVDHGLQLSWFKDLAAKPLKSYLDVEHFTAQQKTYPAPKQGAFNQALGNKTRQVIDATGGWGNDALLMCAQGYQVEILERHPVMALLLSDAMRRLSQSVWANTHNIHAPQVIEMDAVDYLSKQNQRADCLYLDPMFPAKRKKSAAVNKNMQFLHWLLGAESDADKLLQAALDSNIRRIAVKRPDYAQALLENKRRVDARFSSKLLHYDVYLNVKAE
ncbi:MAG: class I SAM-dependent methyltransferase [Acidiferrobacterales bacterium]|nr:class I SAM-dependent methyltransferase [Acidiferrobacterales bacterium]